MQSICLRYYIYFFITEILAGWQQLTKEYANQSLGFDISIPKRFILKNNLSKILMTIFICLFFVFLVADLYASTKEGYAIARIEHFSNAINRFHKDVGRYPSNNEGLKILIEKPKDVANWKGPYLPYPIIPTDPWNNEYVYIFPAIYGYKPFDLYSFGPNGIDDKGHKDDLANWKLIK